MLPLAQHRFPCFARAHTITEHPLNMYQRSDPHGTVSLQQTCCGSELGRHGWMNTSLAYVRVDQPTPTPPNGPSSTPIAESTHGSAQSQYSAVRQYCCVAKFVAKETSAKPDSTTQTTTIHRTMRNMIDSS